MRFSRRSLIIGAGLASAPAHLVRAESLLEIPGAVRTAEGLRLAKQWANNEFNEMPGCRLIFDNGDATRWFAYQSAARFRPANGGRGGREPYAFAISMEVRSTDQFGNTTVNNIPVDGMWLTKTAREREQRRTEREVEAFRSIFQPDRSALSAWYRNMVG